MLGPAFQLVNDNHAPFAIGEGQTLVVASDGVLSTGFVAGPDSKLLFQGGSAGSGLRAFGAEIQMLAGIVGQISSGCRILN